MAYISRIYRSWYQWNNRPEWPYIGIVRIKTDPRKFSIKDRMKLGETRYKWTIADQAWAVSEGFFVQREVRRERPVIVGIDPKGVFAYDENDGSGPYREIVRRCFQRPADRYDKLLMFIKQQDEYGFTGAWDIAVQEYSPKLIWYKNYIDKMEGGMDAYMRRRAIATKKYLTQVARQQSIRTPPKDFDEVAYMNADVTTAWYKRKARFMKIEAIDETERARINALPKPIIDEPAIDTAPTPITDPSWD